MVFDNDAAKIGKSIGPFIIQDMANLVQVVQSAHIVVAMITVPPQAAQSVADLLVKAGIKAILNYAPVTLAVPAGVHVQHIDPVIHLQRMTYYLE